jgi:hypothetical protein
MQVLWLSSQSLSTANQWAEFLADVDNEGEEEFDLQCSKYCNGLSQENVPEAAKNPPEQLKIEKFEKTRFHEPAPPKIGQYCIGKAKDAGTPVRRSPRALV